MNNQRLTAKDRGLIKGAIMRAFSRSALRKSVLERCIVPHIDESRPRVKTWCRCEVCGTIDAKSYLAVDHIKPKIPVDSSLEEMTWDELVNNTWCSIDNLQGICDTCHIAKSKLENLERKKNKKGKK